MLIRTYQVPVLLICPLALSHFLKFKVPKFSPRNSPKNSPMAQVPRVQSIFYPMPCRTLRKIKVHTKLMGRCMFLLLREVLRLRGIREVVIELEVFPVITICGSSARFTPHPTDYHWAYNCYLFSNVQRSISDGEFTTCNPSCLFRILVL